MAEGLANWNLIIAIYLAVVSTAILLLKIFGPR